MGIISDFVLATEEELRGALVAWRRVSPEPRRVRRTGVNPFTKKPFDVEALEWLADPTSPDPMRTLDLSGVQLPDRVARALQRLPKVTEAVIIANKLSILEERGLSALPRVQWSGITTLELESLGMLLLGEDGTLPEEIARPALLPPEVVGDERWVHRLPDRLVSALAELRGPPFEATAAAWAEDARVDSAGARDLLSALAGFCLRAISERKHVFLWGGV